MTAPAGGDSIYVNYGVVTDVYNALVDADRAIQTVMDELQTTIAGLQATWSGLSDAEYTQVQAYWNAQMTDMNQVLTHFHGTLDEMAINYSNTDNKLAFQWSAVH
jgi:WXG100 family type VII secretion target